MNSKRIVIDGKSYSSVDEMPEDVRRQYEEAMRGFQEFNPDDVTGAVSDLKNMLADKNHNGMPDVFEGYQVTSLAGGMKFIVDGRSFDSLEELPPQARAKYEQAMGSLDANRNGTPDILEALLNPSNPTAGSVDSTPRAPQAVNVRDSSRTPITGKPALAPDTSNGWGLALMGLLLLMFCAFGALGVWYFLLR